jgi:Haem-binding domain
MIKKILYVLLAAFVIIQFFRPERNQSAGPFPNDITTQFALAEDSKAVLVASCYDCHSNNTNYPWYANVQPVAWWLEGHVKDGKKHLNFSEFTTYAPKKQHHKFEEIKEALTDGWMPLESYTWIHKNSILTKEQSAALVKWCEENMAKLPVPDPKK